MRQLYRLFVVAVGLGLACLGARAQATRDTSSMKSRTLSLALVILIAMLAPLQILAADAKLFSMRIESHTDGAEKPGAPTFNYTLQITELERKETTSILEFIYTPARHPDETDLLRGLCGLLKARGEEFLLRKLRLVSKEPLQAEVTFVTSAPVDEMQQLGSGIISLAHCEKFWLPHPQVSRP